jgi:hypothetical protein
MSSFVTVTPQIAASLFRLLTTTFRFLSPWRRTSRKTVFAVKTPPPADLSRALYSKCDFAGSSTTSSSVADYVYESNRNTLDARRKRFEFAMLAETGNLVVRGTGHRNAYE